MDNEAVFDAAFNIAIRWIWGLRWHRFQIEYYSPHAGPNEIRGSA